MPKRLFDLSVCRVSRQRVVTDLNPQDTDWLRTVLWRIKSTHPPSRG